MTQEHLEQPFKLSDDQKTVIGFPIEIRFEQLPAYLRKHFVDALNIAFAHGRCSQAEQIAGLQAIIDKFSTTADGKPAMPGSTLYLIPQRPNATEADISANFPQSNA